MVKQLYLLQEIELEIESNEKAIEQIARQLEGDEAVARLQSELAIEEQHLEELKGQQHAVEWETEDIAGKLKATEGELYSGKIGNPKELTNLQHEADALKVKRNELEDRALEVMEQVETAEATLAAVRDKLGTAEADWQERQRQLSGEMEQLQSALAELKHKRQSILTEIDSGTAEVYYLLKKQKGKAVARVEQGRCLGCRITLPTAEVQRARSGHLVQCSSCGRILFLP